MDFSWESILPYLWIGLAILLGVAEAVTIQLVAVWFAVGALAAVIPAALGASVTVQFGVFVAVSAVALILTRPLVKKVLTPRRERTNADRLIGTIGVVIEEIDNFRSKGRVTLSGLDWAARSEDGEIIPPGAEVLVNRIEGVTLIVERIA